MDVLDTGVLGLIAHPSKAEPHECKKWMLMLLRQDVSIYVPEIADYELRRKLLHLGFAQSIERLDALRFMIGYIPITTAAMTKAAEFWASARRAGNASSLPQKLICAAAVRLCESVAIGARPLWHVAFQ